MALTFAPYERELKIVKINADEKTGRHLSNLGFTVGGVLTLLSSSGGDCIVKMKESRLAINRALAMKIIVDEDKTLDKFLKGESGRVKKLTATGAIRRRLLDMGITPGAEITMRKTAPLGDPMEITLRGYELTLRKAEAAFVITEEKA